MYALTIPRAISANAQTLNPAQIKQIDDIAKSIAELVYASMKALHAYTWANQEEANFQLSQMIFGLTAPPRVALPTKATKYK